jgi:hypothetical protein
VQEFGGVHSACWKQASLLIKIGRLLQVAGMSCAFLPAEVGTVAPSDLSGYLLLFIITKSLNVSTKS